MVFGSVLVFFFKLNTVFHCYRVPGHMGRRRRACMNDWSESGKKIATSATIARVAAERIQRAITTQARSHNIK